MAKKKDNQEEASEGLLVSTAKTIGTAVGKVASAVGITGAAAQPKTVKIPKLAKKNKARLPRKMKKAQKKAAAKEAALMRS